MRARFEFVLLCAPKAYARTLKLIRGQQSGGSVLARFYTRANIRRCTVPGKDNVVKCCAGILFAKRIKNCRVKLFAHGRLLYFRNCGGGVKLNVFWHQFRFQEVFCGFKEYLKSAFFVKKRTGSGSKNLCSVLGSNGQF